MKIVKKIILGIALLFVALLFIGFLLPDDSNHEKDTVSLLSGLVANIGKDARVGIGNIYIADYIDESGAKKHGPVVWLSFLNSNDDPEEQKLLAHEGQIIKIGDQTIKILKINAGWFFKKASIIIHTLTPQEALLADPDLLYSSRFWSGLCGNERGEDGGCITDFYLYNSGKVLKTTSFTKYLTNVKDVETTENQLNQNFINEIINQINNSGILTKICAPETIYDVGWDYQININGVKKLFRNPPSDCRDTFDRIDNLLNDELKTASPTQ